MTELSVGQRVRVRPDANGDGLGLRGRRGVIEAITEVPPLEGSGDDSLRPGFLVHLAGEGQQHGRWVALPCDALEAE